MADYNNFAKKYSDSMFDQGDFYHQTQIDPIYLREIYEPESIGFAKDFSKDLQKSHHIPTYIIIGAVKYDNPEVQT